MGPPHDGLRRREDPARHLVIRPFRRAAATAALALAVAAGTSARADDAAPQNALAPEQVFERARDAANARRLPAYLSYRVDLRLERRGKTTEEHDRVTVRLADGVSFVEPFAAAPRERVDPTPRVAPKPPIVNPVRTFGLATNETGGTSAYEAPVVAPAEPAAGAVEPETVIGRVRAARREYDVRFAPGEPADAATYHLLLEPRFAPEANRLRELVVDRATFRLVRAVIRSTGRIGPTIRHPLVRIDYVPLGDGVVIAAARAQVTLRALFLTISGVGTVAISDVAPHDDAPAWMFDRGLLAQHRAAASAAPAGEPVFPR